MKTLRSTEVQVPEPMIDLARRRTDFLYRHIQWGSPMHVILASAYIQGMNDMLDAMDAAGLIKNRK